MAHISALRRLRSLSAPARQQAPLCCLTCHRVVVDPLEPFGDYISCVHCQQVACVQCFTEKAELTGEQWHATLQCQNCNLRYWPTIFINEEEYDVDAAREKLFRQKQALRLLTAFSASASTETEACHVCFQYRVDDFQACETCRFPVCRRCTLVNWASGSQCERCPGCRNALDITRLMAVIEAGGRARGKSASLSL